MYFNCGVGEDLRVSWTARRSNQSTLKEISPEDSLEGPMLKLKLQYLGHLTQRGRNINEPKIELFSHISCCPENGVQILFLGTEADLNYSGPYRNVISMIVSKYGLVSIQFSCSVMSSCLWPHEPQHTRPRCPSPTPGVYTQTHVHRVGNAIQPSHPLSSPSPPALCFSQHQGLD